MDFYMPRTEFKPISDYAQQLVFICETDKRADYVLKSMVANLAEHVKFACTQEEYWRLLRKQAVIENRMQTLGIEAPQ
jgi:hypothetical protein